MPTRTSGKCIKTQFDKKILCAGTMTDYVQIYARELQATTINNSTNDEVFTTVLNIMGYLEGIKAVQRFNGVNITSSATHVVYLPFDQIVYELDRNTNFVSIERTRQRWFKMIAIDNYGEQDEYLAILLKETGFQDIKATEA